MSSSFIIQKGPGIASKAFNYAKKLITGLQVADAQTKMYEDTLRLIATGKRKMIDDLKIILDDIEPIQNG